MGIACDDIRGRTVIDAGGLAIGEVETVLIEPSSLRVEAIRIRLRREMTEQVGAERSLFRRAAIDVPTEAVQSVGDAVLLQVKVQDLREGPHAEEPGVHAAT